jgi:hypothetical protein
MIKGPRAGWVSEAISQGWDGVVWQQEGRVSWFIPAVMGPDVSIPAASGWQQHDAVPLQGMTNAAAACPVRVRLSSTTTNHGMRLRIVAIKPYP